jgi:enamine deaminase RidA (YjgF/YER057c/UK114 family)
VEVKQHNPHRWLVDAFHVHQAVEVVAGQRIIFVSGQTANTADGASQHPGDLVAQFKLAFQNLTAVLASAGMKPSNIVRLNFYTTDVDMFMANAGEIVPVFVGAGCNFASTLLGVTRLFDPSIMIEIEATAVA